METYFNIRSLAVALFAIFFILSLCMVHYLHSRKTYPGFSAWVTGIFLCSTAAFFLGLRTVLPDFITIIVANGVGTTSFFLIYFGFKSFAEEKVNIYLHGVLISLYSFALFPLLTYAYGNLNLRIFLVSFTSGVYLLLCATTLVRSARRGQTQLNKFLFITLILFIAVRFSRGMFYLVPSHSVSEYMTAGPFLGMMTLLTSILAIALVIGMMQMNTEKLEKEHQVVINDLQTALGEIKTLRGILPICSHCKRIRDDNGSWDILESYITKHSEAKFSHGICQECANKYYPGMNLYDE